MNAFNLNNVFEERPNELLNEHLIRILGELRKLEVLAKESYDSMAKETKKKNFVSIVKGISSDEVKHAKLIDEIIRVVKKTDFNIEIVRYQL